MLSIGLCDQIDLVPNTAKLSNLCMARVSFIIIWLIGQFESITKRSD